jgi:hypothetical protein
MSVVLSDEEVKLYFAEIATGKRSCRIRNGKGQEIEIELRQPTVLERRKGIEIYKEAFDDCIANGIRTRKQLEKDFLERYKSVLMTEEDQVSLTRIESELKVIRRQLLRYDGEVVLVRQKREELDKKEKEYYAILSKRLQYYTETAEYQAESAEIYFYAKFCIPSLWPAVDSFSNEQDQVIKSLAISHLTSFIRGFDQSTLRALARNLNIRTRWRIANKTGSPFFGIPMQGGSQFFESPTADWTGDQVGLCSWLLYYDDVIQAFEAPEWLLKDDEKLDTWVDKKMQEKESERIKKLGMSGDRSAYDHQDVIVFGDDKDLLFGEGSPYVPAWDKGKREGNITDQKKTLGR